MWCSGINHYDEHGIIIIIMINGWMRIIISRKSSKIIFLYRFILLLAMVVLKWYYIYNNKVMTKRVYDAWMTIILHYFVLVNDDRMSSIQYW